ncbi:protein-L-isoaspartate(D-aspartate) O-methyltransferase [Janthinobacterium agaricidamnosum]|uniref:Protein-L-isoaspartate O-methyltransferase n=1 Tax=Janthinobacterium agaricidamnosum NBRC 102515 = DSM 9628 TaxID=1349767 RepID=W0V926_9BURK|nr:protein-L-isoaspartate(D-aspartate) O-methyltransferase [Janthinobacterium agaricidamnosum]CDG84090.1 protein-L-isoaspartate O-methyltransferase [Janthinobacterium agaricidamnosum NBRC 102515 = DSM 9628]
MNDKHRTFPLPLSSVVDKPVKKAGTFSPAKVATPQTATQNAAQNAGRGGHGYADAAASPSRSHSHAQERTQPASGAMAPRPDAMVSEAVRRAMVARVARQGVRDGVVLAALQTVPRHLFVEEAMASQAYIDASLPIGHHQTISQPYIVARMIEAMRNGGRLKRVLEIGTGCGYQAAVLSLVAQEVYSIERIRPLHELAKANLRPLRVPNLRLHYGDGMLGLPQAAPFDGIILAAAGLEVPQALLEQLATGGRLVAPVGARLQHLQLITRVGTMEWTSETLEDCHFVPLRPGTV